MMPPQPEGWGARSGASTAPTSRPETTPVYDPSAGYQPTVPPSYPSVVPPYAPPRSRSPLGWIIAFIGTGLFVVVVLAVMFIARAGRRAVGDFHAPSPPREMAQQPGETPLNEANADQVLVSGNETTLIKTFALDEDAKFSIKNVSGSIVVEGWDQPKAEVKVIRQGPDRGGQVFFTSTSGNLSLRTAQPGRASQDVRYEVKLPREMGRVTLNSLNGSIKLTGVSGQIFAEGTNGSIELTDVTGVSKVQTVNGKIKAVLQEASDGPMEFTAANGSIDLTIKSDFDADLEASTVRGGINIDDQFGITVQKEMVGQRARGQIGSGGEPLRISTVNGSMSIRLAK